jgi:diaminopimelate epimerase
MSRRVPVSKLHGARNDFVVLDARAHPIDAPAALARSLCDRHAGIGADGLLLLQATSAGDIAMRVINADGSEAEMCGNGIRCVARYLDERGEGGEHDVATAAGIIHTSVVARGPAYEVRVDMGVPKVLGESASLPGATIVDLGNPHVVQFVDDIEGADLLELGTMLQYATEFPNGVNVHLAAVESRAALRVRHFERGVGLTMACGTGAVACAAAGIARGLTSSPVRVTVPGGVLSVAWDGTGHALMTGPAVHVFDTTVDVP